MRQGHSSFRPRTLASILLVGLIPILLACSSGSESAGEPAAGPTAEILWDTWGVPHVFAESEEALFHAAGWAQAKAHGDLVLRLYGAARGRAAELWGEEHLESDRWIHTVGVPARAEEWLEAQSPEARRALEAFVDGFNAYTTTHPERIDDEAARALPVVATDVMAHSQQAIHFTFIAHPRRIAFVRDRWLEARGGGDAGEAPASESGGSNAWAVAPSRSASGNALLLANPHLPWDGLFTWFEQQLTGPDIDSYGASLVGTPFLGIAFNDRLGWTHTVNTLDVMDLYELRLAEGGVDAGYVFDGEVRPFEVGEHTLRVREEDGAVREETLVVRSSVHGPVVARDDTGALALRVAGLDQPHLFDQYAAMNRARNLEEFEAALSRLQMPMFTTMYADRDGHVLHLFGGRIPVRPEGDWNWEGIVPGDTSETLWTETHEYDELPRVVDPGSGWLQNANDPPWTTTFPRALDPEDFPRTMAPRFMHFRAQQSARLLAEDESMTFEEMVAAKHSTEMELAVRILDDLEAAVAEHGDEGARRGMEILAAWDRRADAESRGAVLFDRFASKLAGAGDGWPKTPWSPGAPIETPDGLADPARASAWLSEAVAEVEELHGRADVPWGDVHRLRVGDHDLPASGGPGGLGVFRVFGFVPAAGDESRRRVRAGDSYVAVIEFSDPVRAEALLSYGNWSQPGSPHVGDQLELLSRNELRPVWRTREEIEANLEEREALSLESAP